MVLKNYLVFIPGIILAFILYSLSQGFNNIIGIELLGYTKSPISTAMIAILLGIFFGNFFNIRESFQKGLDFSKDYIFKRVQVSQRNEKASLVHFSSSKKWLLRFRPQYFIDLRHLWDIKFWVNRQFSRIFGFLVKLLRGEKWSFLLEFFIL